jgi:hypothetical protein
VASVGRLGSLEVGSIRTRRSSARGAGPNASRRSRSRRSSSSGLTLGDYGVNGSRGNIGAMSRWDSRKNAASVMVALRLVRNQVGINRTSASPLAITY